MMVDEGHHESIEVYVRVRPFLDFDRRWVIDEAEDNKKEGKLQILSETNLEVFHGDDRRDKWCSEVDWIFGPGSKQHDVFAKIQESVDSVCNGYNATVMAYGQTGSGKTHTMFGPPVMAKGEEGLVTRCVSYIFKSLEAKQEEEKQASSWKLYCSFLQIYNEEIFDMLRDEKRDYRLEIHEDDVDGCFVEGLGEFRVRCEEECLELIRRGEYRRAVRETHRNEVSSRSHSVLTLLLEQKEEDATGRAIKEKRSKLHLVDLAGSERWDTRMEMERGHVAELTNINRSLYTLGRCISSLASTKDQGLTHVPFRESKLTRLLQDSLGGNTKTKIITTISPCDWNIEETISTLRFADNAKQVMAFVRVNDTTDTKNYNREVVLRLQREVVHLRSLLESAEKGCDPDRSDLLAIRKDMYKDREKIIELEKENRRLAEELRLAQRTDKRGVQSAPPTTEASLPPPMSKTTGSDAKIAHLVEDNRSLMEMMQTVKTAAHQFFAFDIEEDDLKRILLPIFRKLDENRDKKSPESSGASPSRPAMTPCPPVPPVIQQPSRNTIAGYPPSMKGPETFRVRRRRSMNQPSMEERSVEQEEEEAVRNDLRKAKIETKKREKLKEWIRIKEAREQEALKLEEQRRVEQEVKERENWRKFQDRARKAKKRLEQYYYQLANED